ncbi:hypothetical protein RUND412_007150 [Rhizina undulata]
MVDLSLLSVGMTVPDHYIVVLKDDVDDQTFEEHRAWATNLHERRLSRRDDSTLSGIHHHYNFATFKGYAGAFDATTIEEIKAHDKVDFVEEDKVVGLHGIVSQNNTPSWGLPRISQKVFRNETTYYYESTTTGRGVSVYVIDTGIYTEHRDFGGRAEFGFNATSDRNDTDLNGHGTHVAGIVAGTLYGVAKDAKVIAVKVRDRLGNGQVSTDILGVDWVVHDTTLEGTAKRSVCNMSIGSPDHTVSEAYNKAVTSAIRTGITFVIAAGNSNIDASGVSPASADLAFTVGSTDRNDYRAATSNYGRKLSLFAPGVEIISAGIGSPNAWAEMSGTSMAAPHVAGLAACFISGGLEGYEAVTQRLKAFGQSGVVKNPGAGSPDSLVYNNSGR